MTSRILPVFALIVAALIFFGYVDSAWTGSVTAAKASIMLDNQALASASEYSTRQDELASARNAIDPAGLARLNAFLPDSVDNVRLILDLDALAARSGLALASIDVAGSSAPSSSANQTALSGAANTPVGSVDLSLAASGSYSAFQNFLRGVESSARLLDITDLSVRGSDTGIYSYQMTIRLYWLR
ncbi:hypothetical protein HY091_00600 [Candidatus Kaiserbacteria bacterium]|nr:hypothetical protein [Candidatus Kaiserbacteria bacterium]